MRSRVMGVAALVGLLWTSLPGCDDESLFTNENDAALLDDSGNGEESRKKGDPLALNGDGDYCNDPKNLCVTGEGDCDYAYQCAAGLVCATDNGANFGFTELTDVCVPSTCTNKVQDNGETGVDCGSPECGNCVQKACVNPPPNGATNHCSTLCPCPATESDCDSDAECQPGLICSTDVGPNYGFPAGYDVCEATTCHNGVQDGDETGVDCGGSCGSCNISILTAVKVGQAGFDRMGGIAIDVGDNSFVVVGQFEGTLTLGATSLQSVGGFDMYVAKFDNNGVFKWAKSYGSPINDGDQELRVSIDPVSHKIAVGGQFAQTVNFGGTNLTAVNTDGFILVLDRNGNTLSVKKYGDVGVDRIADVQYDSAGALYAAGVFTTKMSFGGSTFTSAGLTDIAVAKLTSTLGHTWSLGFGNAASGEAIADITVDTSKNLYFAGTFGGTEVVGGTSLVSKGSTDAMIVKITSGGGVGWAKSYGGTGNDAGIGVATDPSLRPTLVGYFKRTVDFGAGNVVAQGASDKTDSFTVALDSGGAFRWVRTFGGTDNDQPLNVASDPVTGDVTVVGYYRGTALNFLANGGSVASAGGNDAFLHKLNASTGAIMRAEHYGSTLDDHAKGVRIYNGIGWVAGDFQGTVNFGGKSLTSSGGKDGWITRIQLN